MKKFFFDCGTRDLTASFGIFVLRVSVGLTMMLAHGIPKIKAYETLRTDWFRPDWFPLSLMSHPVSLMLTIGAEVGASGLLILGLATRPAAFVFSFAMVVAAFDLMGHAPFEKRELALGYLLAGVVILLTGAGSWSLDAGLCKEGKRRRW